MLTIVGGREVGVRVASWLHELDHTEVCGIYEVLLVAVLQIALQTVNGVIHAVVVPAFTRLEVVVVSEEPKRQAVAPQALEAFDQRLSRQHVLQRHGRREWIQAGDAGKQVFPDVVGDGLQGTPFFNGPSQASARIVAPSTSLASYNAKTSDTIFLMCFFT